MGYFDSSSQGKLPHGLALENISKIFKHQIEDTLQPNSQWGQKRARLLMLLAAKRPSTRHQVRIAQGAKGR
jgi:hypothetical protein